MNANDKFISFFAVINIKTADELAAVLDTAKKRGYSLFTLNLLEKIGFNGLHFSAGQRKIEDGELCIEYQVGKGFTYGDKKSYEDYGCEILSSDDFILNKEG